MLALMRRRDFALVWVAGLISMMGDWVLFTALPIYVYQLTNSALATSAMFAAELIPALFLSSFAGVFVDRWDRKRVMIVSNLLLGLGLLPLLLVHSADDIWIVYLVAFFEALVAQFFSPAENAFLPTLAPPDLLVAANSLNMLNNNLARLIGPAVGGLIATQIGLSGVALIDALSFVLAAVLVFAVATPGKIAPVATDDAVTTVEQAWQGVWREWLAGLRLVGKDRAVALLMAIFALSALGEGVMGVIFVIWVTDVLQGGAQQLGWLMSAQAIGGIVGGLTVGLLNHTISPLRLAGWGSILFALIDIALFSYPVLLPQLWPGLVLIAVVGLPAAASGASWMTLLQTSVQDRFRGRIFGALGTTTSLLRLIGLFIAGSLGGLFSPILLLNVFQGGSYLLVGLVALVVLPRFINPSLRRVVSQPMNDLEAEA